MHCPDGNATELTLKCAGLFRGNHSWTPLKLQHSNPNPNPLVNQLWSINFLTPPTPLTSLTDSLPSLNLLCHSKTYDRFMQDAPKAFHTFLWHFLPGLKQNFIAYSSSNVSSRPDCIFEIHQRWQSGFSRVYFNCCCSCWFELEIIKIGQSSHKMYSNNIVNVQGSTTILNSCTKKKSRNLFKAPRILFTKNVLVIWEQVSNTDNFQTICFYD